MAKIFILILCIIAIQQNAFAIGDFAAQLIRSDAGTVFDNSQKLDFSNIVKDKDLCAIKGEAGKTEVVPCDMIDDEQNRIPIKDLRKKGK